MSELSSGVVVVVVGFCRQPCLYGTPGHWVGAAETLECWKHASRSLLKSDLCMLLNALSTDNDVIGRSSSSIVVGALGVWPKVVIACCDFAAAVSAIGVGLIVTGKQLLLQLLLTLA